MDLGDCVETTASSSTGGPTLPPGCPGVDVGARAEFWVEGRESTEGDVACTAIGVRLAMDDLDVEVDLECDDAIDPGDTGPTVSRWTIKIGPAVERPAIAVGDAVVFRYELADLVACDEQSQFVLWREDGELVAAGLASATSETMIDAGTAGPLTLAHGLTEDACLAVTATLGESSAVLARGSSEALTHDGATYRIEVGAVLWPESVGDDCGGNATLYTALVVRSP